LSGILEKVPSRCVPIIAADLNDEVTCEPGDEAIVGSLARRKPQLIMRQHQLMIASTYTPSCQPTFFGQQQDQSASRIDFICLPQSAHARMTKAMTLARSGKKLQLIPDSRPRDHRPVMVLANLGLSYTTLPAVQRIDRDKLLLAWRTGVGRLEFLEQLEQEMIHTASSWQYDEYNARVPDEMWDNFVTTVKTVAMNILDHQTTTCAGGQRPTQATAHSTATHYG
jgi:hypothetical protein